MIALELHSLAKAYRTRPHELLGLTDRPLLGRLAVDATVRRAAVAMRAILKARAAPLEDPLGIGRVILDLDLMSED